jgi:hypothetical protein
MTEDIKTASIADFLNEEEMKLAISMYRNPVLGKTFASRIRDELIDPNMDRINCSLGQENDPLYLAYAIEYVMMKADQIDDKKNDPKYQYLQKIIATKGQSSDK